MNEPNPPQPSTFGYDPADDEIDLWELWDILWSEKWWIIGASLLFGAGGATYSLLATPIYEAKVVLSPVQQTQASGASSLLAQFAPIAGLAGIAAPPQIGVAVLQSAKFAEGFVVENNLEPILLRESGLSSDKVNDGQEGPQHHNIDAAIERLQQATILTTDVKTGLVTLRVRWKDPKTAATWANGMAEFANDTLRDRALFAAERNLSYLKSELPSASSVSVQQAIGRLLDQEMQTVMLAKGNEEFAFKIIDPARTPKSRIGPQRVLITVGALVSGGGVMFLFLFCRWSIRKRPRGRPD